MDELSPGARRLAAPRWLDARLVGGVLLVLLSVVVGARVVALADRSAEVWTVVRPLGAGTVVEGSDVQVGRVRFPDSDAAAYVGAASSPVGRTLARPVGAGELLPVAAFGDGAPPLRHVAVPVSGLHAPADAQALRSTSVDVLATTDVGGGARSTQAVLRNATVVDVRGGTGLSGSGDLAVVVAVAPEDVPTLVAAVRGADLDVVAVQGEGGEVPAEPVRVPGVGAAAGTTGSSASAGSGSGGSGSTGTGSGSAGQP